MLTLPFDLNEMYLRKAMGDFIKSAKWAKEGERNSAHFHGKTHIGCMLRSMGVPRYMFLAVIFIL